jgi:hypothetical protein
VEAQGNLPAQQQSTCGGGTDSRQLESARQSEETSAAAQPITTSARRDTSIYMSTEIHLDQSVSNSHCIIISASGRYTGFVFWERIRGSISVQKFHGTGTLISSEQLLLSVDLVVSCGGLTCGNCFQLASTTLQMSIYRTYCTFSLSTVLQRKLGMLLMKMGQEAFPRCQGEEDRRP